MREEYYVSRTDDRSPFIALNVDRIQLIERFYDPLAGNILVRYDFL